MGRSQPTGQKESDNVRGRRGHQLTLHLYVAVHEQVVRDLRRKHFEEEARPHLARTVVLAADLVDDVLAGTLR